MIDDIEKALESGGIVLLPTETVFGLAAKANLSVAVDRIYDAKGRDFDKPLAVFVCDLEQAQTLGHFNDLATSLAEKHWPGSVTIIVPTVPGHDLDPRVMQGATIAMRCPDVSWRDHISSALALTSANRSGEPDCMDYDTAMAQFGDFVDASLDAETSLSGVPSTIVSTIGDTLKIIRQGHVIIDGISI